VATELIWRHKIGRNSRYLQSTVIMWSTCKHNTGTTSKWNTYHAFTNYWISDTSSKANFCLRTLHTFCTSLSESPCQLPQAISDQITTSTNQISTPRDDDKYQADVVAWLQYHSFHKRSVTKCTIKTVNKQLISSKIERIVPVAQKFRGGHNVWF